MRALVLLCLMSSAAMAQTDQPYAGDEARDIAALSDDRIAGLEAGAGLGYALSAELNGWPGPLHVLEIAEEIGLSDDVRAEVEAIRQEMLTEAQALGRDLIAAEARLDALFDTDAPEPEAVSVATAEIAGIEGRLRAAHLTAHLRTTPLLTRHQKTLYARARGYETGGHVGHGGMSHGGHGN